MHRRKNKLKAAVVTANEKLQNQIETISKEIVERIKSFKDSCFNKEGQNLWGFLSLKAYMNWIVDGHFIDETFNGNDKRF